MNIIVLIKHVVDSTEVRFDKKTGNLRLRGLPEKISDYDKHALEAAIKIKDKMGGKVTALSFGSKDAIKSLKECVAMGADHGVLVLFNKTNEICNPTIIAETLAKAIQHIGSADIVLCGAMTEDVTNKIVGSSVAAKLKIPHIANVKKIDIEKEEKVYITSELDGFEIDIEAQTPLVMSVLRKLNEPRLATKIQIMKVQMKKISTITLEDIGMTNIEKWSQDLKVESFTPITNERKKIILEDDTSEAVSKLIELLKEEGVL
ncbi:electron transfer flavoprotein subunit beta/FixA family protein [Desulforhopalus singaporensis]|uniref:Electron transfer flavoprotein beta subunit n=1 Tax=Desulforhopalus singaporensis TaxID=91360 RepID=A0A1H0VCQ3_9BACT|nr:electron transfer flavoprotein subunit beta/FixA family protein [Desulforhopalus singaporensis]SDP76349.1 electron transfer flavoprotein beta subunit [Desulforhopalus singaporensis]